MSAATAIQATLAQAGIEAEIISGSGEQIYGAMRERNFELLVGRGGGGQLPHPDSNLRALVYNPDNSDEAKLTNFQGWRTSFFDPELNAADRRGAGRDRPGEAGGRCTRPSRSRSRRWCRRSSPSPRCSNSVAYRADLEGFVLNPSWGTDLGAITKAR